MDFTEQSTTGKKMRKKLGFTLLRILILVIILCFIAPYAAIALDISVNEYEWLRVAAGIAAVILFAGGFLVELLTGHIARQLASETRDESVRKTAEL